MGRSFMADGVSGHRRRDSGTGKVTAIVIWTSHCVRLGDQSTSHLSTHFRGEPLSEELKESPEATEPSHGTCS